MRQADLSLSSRRWHVGTRNIVPPLPPRRHHRTYVVLAAALMALFMASGVRTLIPGLREDTRAQSPRRVLGSSRALGARARESRAPGGAPHKVERHVVRSAPPRFLPRHTWDDPAPLCARCDGSDALGVSLPKSQRWAALGGHGRHGPGAGI